MNYLAIDRSCTDKQGAPIDFTIDTEGVLSVTFRPKESSGAWKSIELIDAGLKARVFGISQNSRGEIYVVVAVGQDATKPADRLFRTAALSNDPDDPGWDNVKTRWSELALNPRLAGIAEILVSAPADETEQPLIVLGTTDRMGKIPVYKRLKSEMVNENTEPFPKLKDADELLDIVAGRSNGACGVYVLYRRTNDIVLVFKGIPDEYGVSLHGDFTTPPGAIALESKADKLNRTDLYVRGNGRFRFLADNQLAWATAEIITEDDGALADRITTRSSLTTDYGNNAAGKLESYPVYRTSVSLPPGTALVDLWAASQVDVEVDGRRHTIDAVRPARIAAPRTLKLSISIRAPGNLHCPHLMLSTNLMRPEQRHLICPDVEVHKKLARLKPGALYEARDALGIGSKSVEEINAAQNAVQNLSRVVQYTYNRRQHGVFHDRAILPQNMVDSHFRLRFADGGARYFPLSKKDVEQHIAGAALGVGEAQGLWDDVLDEISKAREIVVYTAKDIASKVVDTVKKIDNDVAVVFDELGEDLVHGDAWSFTKHLLQGGANIGTDLFVGAANVAGRLLSGAGQLLAVAIDLGGKVVTFILDHTGPVGQLIRGIFERIGAQMAKVVAWLLEKIGGPEVVHIHDTLIDTVNLRMDGLKDSLEHVRKFADDSIGRIESEIDRNLDGILRNLGTLDLDRQPTRGWSVSTAVEQSEWLVSRVPDAPADALPGASRLFSLDVSVDAIETFFRVLDSKVGYDSPLLKRLNSDAGEFLQSLGAGPQAIISAALKLLKSLARFVLEAAKALVDGIVDLLEATIEFLKQLLNAPFEIPFISDVYKEITKREHVTILGLISLILAIPVAMAYRMFGVDVHKLTAVAAELPAPTAAVDGWGIFYGVTRIMDGAFATAIDVYTGVRAKEQAGKFQSNGFQARFQESYYQGLGPGAGQVRPLNLTAKEFIPDMLFRGWNLIFGLLQLGSVMPTADLTFGIVAPGGWEQVTNLQALSATEDQPNYWGAVYYWTVYAQFLVLNVLSAITMYSGIKNFGGQSGVGKLDTKMGFEIFNDVETALGGFFGILTMAFMSCLDVADRNKMQYLKAKYFQLNPSGDYEVSSDNSWQNGWTWKWTNPDASGRDTTQYFVPNDDFKALTPAPEAQQKIAAYLKWAEQGGIGGEPPKVAGVKRLWGIERKGFGNVVGSLEGIGKFGAITQIVRATDGFSLIATVGLDLLGGLGEGITTIVRIHNNEIY
jgi:hypothetical protein